MFLDLANVQVFLSQGHCKEQAKSLKSCSRWLRRGIRDRGGVVRCVDPKTGETIWTERIGGNFSASPLGADGRVYLTSEEGETVVLEAGRRCVVLARNTLGELCRASPAVSRGRIFIRTDQNLYAIGAQSRD